MQKQNLLKTLGKRALDIIFPKICPVCGAFGAAPCTHCISKIKPYQSECCACQKISEDFRTHKECLDFFPLARVLIPTEYDKTTKKIVGELKFKYVKNIAPYIAESMAELLQTSLKSQRCSREVMLVPIPLHPRRKRERGFNQSELLCKEISKQLGIPTQNLLKRIRYTTQQKTLDREKRLINLSSAFIIDPEKKISPNSLIILVDDIVTTGATLSACAKAIKHHFPFAPIWGLVYSRQPKTD